MFFFTCHHVLLLLLLLIICSDKSLNVGLNNCFPEEECSDLQENCDNLLEEIGFEPTEQDVQELKTENEEKSEVKLILEEKLKKNGELSDTLDVTIAALKATVSNLHTRCTLVVMYWCFSIS